jgi:hypothetical protein
MYLFIHELKATGYPSHVLQELAYGQWAPPGPGDIRGPCPGIFRALVRYVMRVTRVTWKISEL